MNNPDFTERSGAYELCKEALNIGYDENGELEYHTLELMECLSYQRSKATFELSRSMFLILCAALVFFMQAGFAMVCAGSVQLKNVQNTMVKNLLDACGAALAFLAIGYAFSFGGWQYEYGFSPADFDIDEKPTFIGTTNFFLHDVEDFPFWLFQFAVSATAATIVAGTIAERSQMGAYLVYSIVLTGFCYPVIAHAIWSPQGFLSAMSNGEPLWGVGMIDFAGAAVVHVTGGFTALFATKILGPRTGRFYDDRANVLDTPKDFPGHSMALQMLGGFILWFGWYGFNCGSALVRPTEDAYAVAALAGVTTTVAAGAGGVTALFINLAYRYRLCGEYVFDLRFAMNGALSGLVASTAACAVVEPWTAMVIGMIAGAILFVGSKTLLRFRIDDVVDAIPVHFFNGVWGVLCVGFFANPTRLQAAYGRSEHGGLFYDGDATLLGVQLVGLLFVMGWVLVVMLPFFVWLDWMGWFRSDPLTEVVGLDASYHGVGYHLISDSPRTDQAAIAAYLKRREERLQRIQGQRLDDEAKSDGLSEGLTRLSEDVPSTDSETNSSTMDKSLGEADEQR